MRTTTLLLSLVLSLFLVSSLHAANYAGTWVLDPARSTNLPPFYNDVAAHSLEVKQDAKTLAVSVAITFKEAEPERFDFTYNLDGTPARSETKMRTMDGPAMVPTTLRAAAHLDGALVLTAERELNLRGQAMKGGTVETWRLDETGKVLTIERVDTLPRGGKRESTMVFVK
jgi:hypothetical protein